MSDAIDTQAELSLEEGLAGLQAWLKICRSADTLSKAYNKAITLKQEIAGLEELKTKTLGELENLDNLLSEKQEQVRLASEAMAARLASAKAEAEGAMKAEFASARNEAEALIAELTVQIVDSKKELNDLAEAIGIATKATRDSRAAAEEAEVKRLDAEAKLAAMRATAAQFAAGE